MSYTESSNVIILDNALPMSDSEGTIQNNYFDFNITSNMTLNSNDPNTSIDYDIELELLDADSGYQLLSNNQVKVYLEDITNTPVSVLTPTLVNDLSTSTTGKIIYSASHIHSYGVNTITTNYRLRAWVDMNVSANDFATTSYEYKFRVNVIGEANLLSKPKIVSVSSSGLTVTASVTSEEEVKYFGFSSNSNNEPSEWIDASNYLTEVANKNTNNNINKLNKNSNNNIKFLSTGHTYTLTYTFDDNGNYYLWLKDKSNNVVNYKDPFIVKSPTFYSTMAEKVNTTAKISYRYINDEKLTISDDVTYNDGDNGVFLYDGTDDNGGTYPIYYYRGNVTDNNVLFGGFCWKIIRTTSTGGTKLIYNGVPTDGTCNNTGEASQLSGATDFNSNYSSPADVGYMYGTRYTYSEKTMTSIADIYYYGNDVTYSDGTYTLVDTTTSVGTNWSTDRTTLANGKHYTCFSTDMACSTVYYITYFGDSSTAYYLTFTGGDTLESAKEKMYTNTNNSTIKTVIDNWYSTNLSTYSSYLENTIFCNDRSFASGSLGGPLASKDANSTDYSYYAAYQRMRSTYSPSLTCINSNDRFSLSASSGGTTNYGNNALTYPVGLITADEISLAGGARANNSKYYLYTGKIFLALSPYSWKDYRSVEFHVLSTGNLFGYYVDGGGGARWVVSLKLGTTISGGTGTANDPYIVKTSD